MTAPLPLERSAADAEARSELYCAAILNSLATGKAALCLCTELAGIGPLAPANIVGVAAGEPERRLSGDGRLWARARHAAASRSSDGSGTPAPSSADALAGREGKAP